MEGNSGNKFDSSAPGPGPPHHQWPKPAVPAQPRPAGYPAPQHSAQHPVPATAQAPPHRATPPPSKSTTEPSGQGQPVSADQGAPNTKLPEDTVYIASEPFKQGDTEVRLDLRETLDGKRAVMAYSSLATLVAGAGEKQPWIALPKEHLPELVKESGADDVLLDTVIAPGLRYCDADGTE